MAAVNLGLTSSSLCLNSSGVVAARNPVSYIILNSSQDRVLSISAPLHNCCCILQRRNTSYRRFQAAPAYRKFQAAPLLPLRSTNRRTRRTQQISFSFDREQSKEEEGSVQIMGFHVSAKHLKIGGFAAVTTALGVSNRVMYKLALVPLKEFPFFLAQFTTFGYVVVYFGILLWRYRLGIVTNEMLALPKKNFALMGALEALGLASGMAAAAVLPGAAIPILTQMFLVWQLILSYVILKKRYTLTQVVGCLLVIAGVIIVVASGSGAGTALADTGLWPLLLAVSTAFPAGASILKEYVFRGAAQQLKGGGVDLFVVNSFGSGFQALFVFLLLPWLSSLRGISFRALPAYFQAGTACFLNYGSTGTGCEGAPLLPLLYVAGNLAFNISMLNLLRASSALVASFIATLSVPLTIAVFTLPLPYLGAPSPLPPGFFSGCFILCIGLLLYNVAGARPKTAKLS